MNSSQRFFVPRNSEEPHSYEHSCLLIPIGEVDHPPNLCEVAPTPFNMCLESDSLDPSSTLKVTT